MPPALKEMIDLLENLPESERRESLIAFAEQADAFAPHGDEAFAFEEVRHDRFCSDVVGIHLRLDTAGKVFFAVSLGPKIQTLTRALVAILARGLNGSSADEILSLSSDFIPRLVGSDLVRLRSQTVFYIFHRLQGALRQAMA